MRDGQDWESNEEMTEEDLVEDLEIPDVYWAEDIRNIENPMLKEREIETAQELLEEQRKALEKHESGEIDDATLQNELDNKIGPKMRRAATRSGLESVGITYDDFGDLSEDLDILAKGDTGLIDAKDRLKDSIRENGPDAAQELADEMLEDGRISKGTHETISRQVRLRKLSSE